MKALTRATRPRKGLAPLATLALLVLCCASSEHQQADDLVLRITQRAQGLTAQPPAADPKDTHPETAQPLDGETHEMVEASSQTTPCTGPHQKGGPEAGQHTTTPDPSRRKPVGRGETSAPTDRATRRDSPREIGDLPEGTGLLRSRKDTRARLAPPSPAPGAREAPAEPRGTGAGEGSEHDDEGQSEDDLDDDIELIRHGVARLRGHDGHRGLAGICDVGDLGQWSGRLVVELEALHVFHDLGVVVDQIGRAHV